jgi:S1-C subfamily serine protease
MPIELRILSGARAGEERRFESPVTRIGRAPDCDLRFDAAVDLDVSAHHAEIRQTPDGFEILDAGSTNGTLVNGRPIHRAHALHTGDVITFGVNGPRASVRVLGEAARRHAEPASAHPNVPHTAQRVSVAVRQQTAWLWRLLVAAVVLLVIVAGIGYLVRRHAASVSQAEIARLVAANQDAAREFQERLQAMHDTALSDEVRRHNATLEARANGAAPGGAAVSRGAPGAGLAQELARSNAVQHALTDMDLPSVRQANDSAIVLIAVELNGHAQQASGFCVSASGVIVTNRHVVADAGGRASRIAVKFAHTREWHAAHVLRLAPDSAVDLALIQMNVDGPYPTVRGVSATGVDAPVGAPIAALGFPPATDSAAAAVGTTANDDLARPTFSTGTIDRSLIGLLQIDAFAGRGSSGSPVFDTHDHVIGVVWGGLASAGRVVYAVPSDRLLPLLPRGIRDSITRADAP